MAKIPRISDQDRALFRGAVGKARPLGDDHVEPGTPRPAPLPHHTRADEIRVLQDLLSDDHDPAELETGEELLYCRPGLQHRLMRKLRRGQFSMGAELDLHGMTVPMARESLVRFLKMCRGRNVRCVRIIHGKGHGSHARGPVLKQKVNHWLRQREDVLAFCSARPVDGGTGAVYVLLCRP
ncbi:MAG: DNA mismatch repair protein MutS [Chromatiales bacterium 21-64-14]|nr:MAG: DNA mismatch repair protein MutS [Chromatiales bacterium 21-64-14]HQU15417.1 Smr/MutS family protein [Gammaproteobacteria bacterium]